MALEKAIADGKEDLNQKRWVDSISLFLDIFFLIDNSGDILPQPCRTVSVFYMSCWHYCDILLVYVLFLHRSA